MKDEQTRPLLVSVHFIVPVSYNEDEADKFVQGFQEAIEDCGNGLLSNADERDGWRSSSSRYLDHDGINVGRCSQCGGWCTDCEKPDPFTEVGCGATYQGKLLCNDCLPSDHPWAF